MNIIEELKISSDKVISNKDLVSIRGGNPDGPCGDGYNSFCCIIFVPGNEPIEGIVCAEVGQSWQEAIQEVYPGSEAMCIPGSC